MSSRVVGPSPYPDDPRTLMHAREFDKFWKASELRRRSEQIQQAAYPTYQPNPYIAGGISRVTRHEQVARIVSLVKFTQPCYGHLPTQPTVRYQFAPSSTLSQRHRSPSDPRIERNQRSSSAPEGQVKKSRLPYIPNYPMQPRKLTRRPPQWNDVLPREPPKGILVLGPLYQQKRTTPSSNLPRI